MKNRRFSQKDFAFICPMPWKDMTKTDEPGIHPGKTGRFCDQCKQIVIDVTDCSLQEVADMQRKDPHLCVAIKTLATAGVALSLAACSSHNVPPPLRVTAGVPAPIPQAKAARNTHNSKPISRIDNQANAATCPASKKPDKATPDTPNPGKTLKPLNSTQPR